MSQKLLGKVALITGGTSGIGLATAKRFVAEGADVFITGRRQNELITMSDSTPSIVLVHGTFANLSILLSPPQP